MKVKRWVPISARLGWENDAPIPGPRNEDGSLDVVIKIPNTRLGGAPLKVCELQVVEEVGLTPKTKMALQTVFDYIEGGEIEKASAQAAVHHLTVWATQMTKEYKYEN